MTSNFQDCIPLVQLRPKFFVRLDLGRPISIWLRRISKTFWCNTRCFLNYSYITIVEHFNKGTFVFNTAIFLNRDQLIFIFDFDTLTLFSVDLYVFVFCYTVLLFQIKGLTVFQNALLVAKFLFWPMYSKYHFLVFLVSVLHLFFVFL